MSEHELERLRPKRTPEQLVSKTDPKGRHPRLQQLANLRHFLIHRRRIAWTIRQENSIGLERQRVGGRSRSGHDSRAHAKLRELTQRIFLHPKVVTNNVESLITL